MRFDSRERLDTWQIGGGFPAIHNDIVTAAIVYVRGRRVLDLGCSYGLLGARLIAAEAAEFVVGVERDAEIVRQARDAGVPITFAVFAVNRSTMPALEALVLVHKLDVLVARRVLPELFGEDLELGRDFARAIAGAGISEMLIEGRVATRNAKNALATVDQEVALLDSSYKEARRVGAVSYLVRR